MPDDEQTAAGSVAGSEPSDAVVPEATPPAPAKLGRVPHEGEKLPDRPAPTRQRPAAPARQPRFQPRRLLPVAGLALLAGCLYGLLSSTSPWLATPSFTPGAATHGRLMVVIDPGHGGMDSGAVAQGVVEKDLNLDVGLRVARLLENDGIAVKLTRQDDHYVPLEARVETANALPAAIFVSIHFNDAQGEGRATGRANGIETYYSSIKEAPSTSDSLWTSLFHRAKPTAGPGASAAAGAGALLADAIQRSLIAHTAAVNRGIKDAGLYVTRRVRWPAVLVEGGFVSHPQEARLLQDPEYRQRIANSIAEGIVSFLGSAQPATGGSPPPPA